MQSLFQDYFAGQLRFDEPLSRHTTIRVGGPADMLLIPKNISDILQALRLAKEQNLPIKVIGKGSNLLVSDAGIRGFVLKISDTLDTLQIEGNEITIGAGHGLSKLAFRLGKKGFSGLEFASGIPGSIGGAVYMNAGAHGKDMAQIIHKVQVIDEKCHCFWLSHDEMQFAYRTSVLQSQSLYCIQVVLLLEKSNQEQIILETEKNKTYRQKTQPIDFPNCGSVFRNPLPNYAGKLIEDAGLKGYRIGNAMVSEKHANFIVNIGGATAKDILDLISYIQEKVETLYQIRLQTEVEIVGK